jgi:lysophospholipase
VGEPAPLLCVPQAPVPRGGAAEWVEGADGVRLRAAVFPAVRARGSVVVSPGRTEPIEKYYEVVEDLRGRSFSVLVHDWRGHGLSQCLSPDPLRGHGAAAAVYLEDFRRLLAAFEARLPRPWLALGHSMGGGLTALALAEGEGRFSGALLSAPMLGLRLPLPSPGLVDGLARLMVGAGRSGAYVAGAGDPLGGRFETNVLTHDRTRWARTHALLTAHPELQLGNVTWGWLAFALELSARMRRLPAGALALPLAVALAEAERLVDNAAARAFAAKVEGARLVEVPGAFHELLMETDERRAVVWAAFDAVAERAGV